MKTIKVKQKVPDPEPAGDGLFSLRYRHPEEYNHVIPDVKPIVGTPHATSTVSRR